MTLQIWQREAVLLTFNSFYVDADKINDLDRITADALVSVLLLHRRAEVGHYDLILRDDAGNELDKKKYLAC